MFCPSCGKETPEGSVFCLHCGKSIIAPSATPSTSLQWEYTEVVLPSAGETLPEVAKKKGEKAPFIGLGDERSVPSALNELWVTWEKEIHQILEEQGYTKEGWEPDPNGYGPSCIEYRKRTVGMSYWGGGQWLIYIILGIVSYGLGFFILPFLMRFEILEPLRIRVRLRRLKT